jgi:thiamine kinase-like enzyme
MTTSPQKPTQPLGSKNSEEKEISNFYSKKQIERMIKDLKEGMQKLVLNIKENMNKKLKELKENSNQFYFEAKFIFAVILYGKMSIYATLT